MKSYTVIIAKTAQFDVVAEDEGEARKLAEKYLEQGNTRVQAQIDQTVWGWDVTDIWEEE